MKGKVEFQFLNNNEKLEAQDVFQKQSEMRYMHFIGLTVKVENY